MDIPYSILYQFGVKMPGSKRSCDKADFLEFKF